MKLTFWQKAFLIALSYMFTGATMQGSAEAFYANKCGYDPAAFGTAEDAVYPIFWLPNLIGYGLVRDDHVLKCDKRKDTPDE
jgi:hypothetical protein